MPESMSSGSISYQISESAFRLVTIETEDTQLHGALVDTGSDAVVVHVHGMCGNFYHNSFIPFLADAFDQHGMSAMFLNTSGHDYLAEAISRDVPRFLGGALATQDQIDRDIAVVDQVLRERFARVYYEGHSFGCDVIMRNLARRTIRADGVVLLSPADSRALQEAFSDETLAAQRARLCPATGQSGSSIVEHLGLANRFEPLLYSEIGIRTGTLVYPIPMSAKAIISFLGDSARVFRYTEAQPPAPGLVRFSIPAFIYLGREDSLLMCRQDVARLTIEEMFHDVTFAAHDQGDHHFTGLEAEVSEEIAQWVRYQDRSASLGSTGARSAS